MSRRVLVFAALLAAVLAGVAIGSRSPLAAQDSPPPMGITPVPGRHSEVRALYFFYFKATSTQQGWTAAEFKDEGQSFYKVDAAPGCGTWTVAPGTKPGLVLEPGGTNCTGFRVDFGEIYWFTVPPIVVTLPPASPPPPATVTVGPTATPPPTVASGATLTPSVPTSTPHPIMTITPTPMFPELPSCSVQVLFYWAGDPAQGGLGGKVGDVTWCGSCNSSCGLWMLGVDKKTLDGFTSDANERIHQLWATVTVEARR